MPLTQARACSSQTFFKKAIKYTERSVGHVLPREAACRRQFPSPVVANGKRRLQLEQTTDHQFSRPVKSKWNNVGCTSNQILISGIL